MRESQIENYGKQRAKNLGWYVRKYTTPSRRSAPDDIFAKEGRVFWVEFKATGEVPTELQDLEHIEMRGYGLTVYVCDSKDGIANILANEDLALEMRSEAQKAYTLGSHVR